jgi:hypothetical protein
MSSRFGPDWRKLAEANKVELSETSLERLEGLSKTLLGLRGLIDWKEEPAGAFSVDELPEAPE